jgi:CelD/BcsL family acetyltransferase involved in cellulose biosynthesis
LVGLRERKTIPVNLSRFTVRRPQVNVLEFVYGGLRGNASHDNCVAILQWVVRSLDQGEADLASWEQLDVQSPLYSCVRQLPRFALRDHFRCHDDHDRWLMNFPKGLDAFFSSLSASQRSKLRRKYKKVVNHFADRIQVRQFCSVADLEPAISAMEEIASKSDKRQFGFGFFDTPRIRDQMTIAAEGGWLKIYVLYLEHKPAAFWMGTVYERCLQADDVGYDPVWSEFSPGIFLFLNILEDLRDADIEIVDFGRVSSQLKQCFAALRRVESRVHIYASTLPGIQLSLLSAAIHGATSLISRTHCLARARRSLWKQLARWHRTYSPIVRS